MTRQYITAVLLVFLFSCGGFAVAQSAMPQNIRAENTLDRLSDVDGLSNSDLLYGIPLPPGGVIGNTYLDDKWNIASFELAESDKLIEGYLVKLDLKGDMLEIRTPKGIKVIDGRKVKSIVWLDSLTQQPHYFVRASNYKLDGSSLTGFFQVLADGELPLFKHFTIFEKDPDYIPALDVGSRDKKIFKREAFYAARNGVLTKITSKKKLLPVFESQADQMENYIKQNKLNMGKEGDLVRLFEYYNSSNNKP